MKTVGSIVKTIRQPDGSCLIRLHDGWHRVQKFRTYVRRGGRFRQWIKMARARVEGVIIEVCLGLASIVEIAKSVTRRGGFSLGLRMKDGRGVLYTRLGLSPK